MNRHEDVPLINVLLIDDRSADVRALREMLVKGGVTNRLHSIGNAYEAMAYLDRRGPYRQAPDVDVVLLSAGLANAQAPRVLEWIRRSARLSSLTVIVLTDADAEPGATDRDFYDAQAVLPKPVSLAALTTTLKHIKNPGAADERTSSPSNGTRHGMEKRNDD